MSDPLLDLAASLKPDDRPDKLRGAINTGAQFNPDEYAKAIKRSAETGVAPTAILRDPKAFEPKIDHAAFVNISPKTADWLVSKMDNAAIAHDDLEVLSGLESASEKAAILARNRLKKAPNSGFWETALGSFIQGSSRLAKGSTTDLSRLGQAAHGGSLQFYASIVDRITGSDLASKGVGRGLDLAEESRTAFDAAVFDPGKDMGGKMVNPDRWAAQLFGVLPDISVGLATAGLGPTASAVSKAPAGVGVGRALISRVGQYLAARTPQIAAQTATSLPSVLSSEIDQMQQNAPGMGRVQAAGEAAPSAVIQSILEGLVEVPIIERMQKARGVVKRVAGLLASSGMESAEEVAQAITSQYMLPDPTGQRRLELKSLWEQARAGFIVGGVFGGGAMITGPKDSSIAFRDNIREISDLAAQSKLKARDAEAFAGFMKGIGGEAFIDADRLTTFFQENGIDPVAGAEMVGSRNYAEAVVAGTDAVVSVADLVSRLKPEQVNALADDLRVAQGELSAREVEDYEEQSAKVDLEKDAAPVEAGPRQTIMEGTYRQLVDAGMAPRVAEVYADRHARVMENLAKDYGQDPIALNERYGLRIMRADPGVSPVEAVLSDGRTVDLTRQSDMEAYLAENPDMDPLFWQGAIAEEVKQAAPKVQTPEFKAWFGGSQAVDEAGQPKVFYHGTLNEFEGFQASDRGIFFAEEPAFASAYSSEGNDSRVIPVYLKAEKPFDYQNPADVEAYKAAGGKAVHAVSQGDWTVMENPEFQDFLKANGYDSYYLVEEINGRPYRNIAVFDPTQIKSALSNTGAFDPNDPNIMFQPATKVWGMAQVESPAFKKWSNDAPVVLSGDADSYEFKTGDKIVVEAYHGTQRPDRIGDRFKKSRATSGPMAYHTNNPEIASNYAKGKSDTSLSYEDSSFENWFKFKPKGSRSAVDLVRAWHHLTAEEKATISERMPDIRVNEETGAIAYEKGQGDPGSYEWELGQTKRGWDRQGNPLKAALETWLNSGYIFGEEGRFMEVLKEAGFPVRDLKYDSPNLESPGVFKNWIKMENPLVTTDLPEGFIEKMQAVAKRDRSRAKETHGADHWDKNTKTLREWVDALGDGGKDGQFAWTSIPDKVTKVLQEMGYDGIVDVGGKMGGDGHTVYVPFEESQVKSAIGNRGTFDLGKSSILFQPGDGSRAARMSARMRKLARTTRAAMDKNMAGEHLTNEAEFAAFDEAVKALQAGDILESKRGFIQFSPDRKVSIALLEGADLTTFIHETGHMYLEVSGDLAQENPDSDGAKEYAKILGFLGVESRSDLTRDHHEKFATAMEAYTMEGKAPTPELRSAFQRVKYWMLHVYRSLSALKVKLNDEIRGVFDRMIAGEDAVSGAEKALELRPMFASAEDMSATQAEYEAYSKMAGKATMTAREAVEAKLMRELMREREANWKEEAAKVAEEVAAELETAPGYVALRTLTQGEDGIKLSKQALLDAGLTQAELNALPRSKSRVYGLEGGMDLQSAAEVLGFRSGDELLTTLRELKPFRERVKEITEARMKAEHGDLMADGSIADEAIEAVHNGHYADLRMAELRVLERMKRGAKPAVDAATKQIKAQAREAASAMPPVQSFRDTAREIVERTAIRDLQPHRYLQARVKASKDAAKAYTALDFDAASEAKRREILNHFLFLEASKAREESTKIAEYARNATDKKFLGRLGKAGGDYLNQWLHLAGRYDFAPASKVAIEQSIQAWAMVKEAEGIIIDPLLFDESRVKNWREVPVVELRALHDALVNIETVARRSRMVLAGDKQVDFEVAVHDLTSQAYGNFKAKALPLDEETRSYTEKALSYAKKWNVDLLKFEEVVDRLDKGDINGPWRRYIFEPMALAQYREFELNRKMTLLLNEAMEQMPKKMRHALSDEVTLEGIGTVKRKWLVSMALNTGNDSNQTKLLNGMGLSSFEGMENFGKALDKLTREEWVFVQKTWDALESLWPEIAALEKRMTGLEPAKIERTPFTVTFADGSTLEMQGGYYPVAYDPKRSSFGKMQSEVDIMSPEGLFKGPVTFKGHTEERVEEASAPMLFNFEQTLSKHVPRVVKDISHREAAMSVAKLLNNQEVRQSVQETLGPEYEAMMMPWLQGTVNDPAGSNTELMSWLGKARSNLVVASLAFRASSVLVQVVDPMRAMIGEHAVKPQHLLGAAAKLSADVARLDLKTIRDIRAMSGEMAGRAENLDRDLRSMWKRNLGKEGFYAEMQRAGMKGLAVADALTSTVVWLGAYDQAIAEGSPKAEAIHAADRVVRLKLMTGAAKDLTKLQRSPDMASKLMTTYMGDAVSVYGMMSRSVHNVANGEKIAASAFAFLMAGMILPVIADAVKGKMPEDDEDKAAWALRKAFFGLPSSIPLVRDVAGSLESGFAYSFSPIASQIAKIPRFAAKYAGDKDIDEESLALDLVDLIGGFAGLPGTGQAMTTLRYLKAVDEGKKPEPKSKIRKITSPVLGAPPKKKGD